MSKNSTVPAVTKSHQFKFLGQKWRFLKHSYEDDYEHGLDSGKQRVLNEIDSIEQRGVDERILSTIEKEVEYLLSSDECENSITDDTNSATGADTHAYKSVSYPHSNSSVASSTTYGGAGAGMGEGSGSGLDSNSMISHLTTYDAQDIQESIKNIKLYYSQQAMDRINQPAGGLGRPGVFVKKEHESINGCFAPEGGNPHVSPRPRMVQGQGQGNDKEKQKQKQKRSQASNSTAINTSPRRTGTRTGPGTGPKSADQEGADRLKTLNNQVNTLNVGKLFKKHSLENSYRVPNCVANVTDK